MVDIPEDVLFGKYVYCTQHLRVHSTGWCTVFNNNKFPLDAQTFEEAIQEAMTKGYLTSDGKGVLFIHNNAGKLVPYK